MTQIHSNAVVDPKAELGEGVEIGPFCLVGADVKLGAGVKLHSHVVVEGQTTIGDETEIYPDHFIFTVLIIEGMAQTAGAIAVHANDGEDEMIRVYFMSIDKAKFRRPVVPGDTLHYHVEKIRNRGTVWRFRCEAKVDGKLAAEAEISAMVGKVEE